MKVLVTGAAGFIGSHLSERLVAQGHDVVGVDCFTDYYARALKDLNAEAVRAAGIPLLELDLARDDLADAVAGVEVIYHLAAQPGIAATVPFETYVRNNITATYRLLEAAERGATPRCFVNVATSSIYGAHATDSEDAAPKPTSYYGVTKLAAEQLALAYHRDRGLPVCSLRVFSAYGERERPEKLYPKLIRCILEDEPFPLYEGSEQHSRSYTYISDVIDGFTAVLDHIPECRGEIFNIGTGHVMTTAEGIAIVERLLERPAKRETRPKRQGDQLRTHANIAKARRVLGYAPHVPPEEGLAAEVRWYRERIHGRLGP